MIGTVPKVPVKMSQTDKIPQYKTRDPVIDTQPVPARNDCGSHFARQAVNSTMDPTVNRSPNPISNQKEIVHRL